MAKAKKQQVRGVLGKQHDANPIIPKATICINDMVPICGALYRVVGIQGDRAIVDMGGTPTPLPLDSLQKYLSCVVPVRGSKTGLP